MSQLIAQIIAYGFIALLIACVLGLLFSICFQYFKFRELILKCPDLEIKFPSSSDLIQYGFEGDHVHTLTNGGYRFVYTYKYVLEYERPSSSTLEIRNKKGKKQDIFFLQKLLIRTVKNRLRNVKGRKK